MLNIMDITVENLAKSQFAYLKEHSIDILNKVIECIQNDDFKSIEEMIVCSPGGNWGENNYYINFAYKEGMEMDIAGLIYQLNYLKEVVKNE